MDSCIYVGKVRHQRNHPVIHRFTYPIFMMFVDLDEVETIFNSHWLWSANSANLAWFREQDFLRTLRTSDQSSLRFLLCDYLQKLGFEVAGPIRLLTQFRYLGFLMNPVSFFYCFDSSGDNVEAIVAQVNNTPWGEEHLYVIDARNATDSTIRSGHLKKEFHVSPFMPMNMHYEMRYQSPTDKLVVQMSNYEGGDRMLDVVMSMKRKDITSFNLMTMLIWFPLMSWQIFVFIYWQALRLRLKSVPFFSHPKKRGESKGGSPFMTSKTKPAREEHVIRDE